MKKTSIDDILMATGGRLVSSSEEKHICGVKQDSREVESGDMFVAIIGDNLDGHRYIAKAADQGCRTFLVSHEEGWSEELREKDISVNVILVDDTVEAMGRLAAWYLESLNIRKVAVTGSVGKTSTRDMIYYVLCEKYNCGRNIKNFNNNIGLPVSILRFDEHTEAAVLEMGMDAFGEIRYLSNIVKPDVGVITNIGVAHMEKLGSREGIFRAKMEMTENLASEDRGGTLIFPADDKFLTTERTAGDYNQVVIGTDYVVEDIADFGIEGIAFTLRKGTKSVRVKLPVAGIHNAVNGALALAAGEAMGVDMETGARGLEKAELTGSRLKSVKGKSISIIDDTYNANPDSMKSAIDVLVRSTGERKVAILGDMFELGDNTEIQHRSVGEYAAKEGVDSVICVGKLGSEIAKGAAGVRFEDREALINALEDYIRPGDLVLVKASRGMKLEEIVERLKEI